MRKKDIDLFFQELDRELGSRADIILVGASAGALMGHIRPSVDIDFEIRLKSRKTRQAQAKLESAILRVSRRAGVAVNYSEDISRWSMVSYLNYRKTAVPYKRIGRLNIKLIAPEYWTIGKMTRFLELDIKDMIKIIKIKKLGPRKLVKLWSRALKASDLSLELGQFRSHVAYFISKYGHRLWGRHLNLKKLMDDFSRAAK